MLDFVRSLIGTVGADCDFVLVVTACVLLLIIVSLILGFFLSFFTCLFKRM